MTRVDDPTYEQAIRRHWAVPGAHEKPERASLWTDYGDREMGDDAGAEVLLSSTPSSGLGFKIAGCVLTAVIVVAAAAAWWSA